MVFSNCKLIDDLFDQLTRNILEQKHLQLLDLSYNSLTDQSMPCITEILEALRIKELLLHWNLVSGDGAAKIFDKLTLNGSLPVLDLSCNRIGHKGWPSFIKSFNRYLRS